MALLEQLGPSIKYSFGNNTKDKIFFLHIHKCGGTSIANAISSTYGFQNNLFSDRFGTLSNDSSVLAAKAMNVTTEKFREFLLLYYMSNPKIKYIGGHFCYSEKAMEIYGDQWKFITILRDPVSRWFSHYFMDRYKKEKSFYAGIDADLDSFIYSERSLWEARKYVLMFNDKIALDEATSEESIEQSVANLRKFSIIGFLDKLDEFSDEFKKKFNTSLAIPNLNKNPLEKLEQNRLITANVRHEVEKICEPSTRVYQAIRNARE